MNSIILSKTEYLYCMHVDPDHELREEVLLSPKNLICIGKWWKNIVTFRTSRFTRGQKSDTARLAVETDNCFGLVLIRVKLQQTRPQFNLNGLILQLEFPLHRILPQKSFQHRKLSCVSYVSKYVRHSL